MLWISKYFETSTYKLFKKRLSDNLSRSLPKTLVRNVHLKFDLLMITFQMWIFPVFGVILVSIKISMSSFDVAPGGLNISSARKHNSDSGGFKVSSSRNSIKSEASLGIPELFPNTRRYVQWLFEQGIMTGWRYYLYWEFYLILSKFHSQFISGLEFPELVLLAASLLQRMLQTLVLGRYRYVF